MNGSNLHQYFKLILAEFEVTASTFSSDFLVMGST